MTSALPYAWQKKGTTIEIPAAKSKRMNVAGLINRKGDFHYQAHMGNISSTDIIEQHRYYRVFG